MCTLQAGLNVLTTEHSYVLMTNTNLKYTSTGVIVVQLIPLDLLYRVFCVVIFIRLLYRVFCVVIFIRIYLDIGQNPTVNRIALS